MAAAGCDASHRSGLLNSPAPPQTIWRSREDAIVQREAQTTGRAGGLLRSAVRLALLVAGTAGEYAGGTKPGPALSNGRIPFPKAALVHNLTNSRCRSVTSAGLWNSVDDLAAELEGGLEAPHQYPSRIMGEPFMPATFSIIGLALNLMGVIVLFRYGMPQCDGPRCGAP